MVPRSQARNDLSNNYIFWRTDAFTPDGITYEKYNARLVMRGFQQLQGIDNEEKYAPGVKFLLFIWFLE